MEIRLFKDLNGKTYNNKYIVEFSNDEVIAMVNIYNNVFIKQFAKYFLKIAGMYNFDKKDNWMLVDLDKECIEKLVIRNETVN